MNSIISSIERGTKKMRERKSVDIEPGSIEMNTVDEYWSSVEAVCTRQRMNSVNINPKKPSGHRRSASLAQSRSTKISGLSKEDALQQLTLLKEQLKSGTITDSEFKLKKSQLIDILTSTRQSGQTKEREEDKDTKKIRYKNNEIYNDKNKQIEKNIEKNNQGENEKGKDDENENTNENGPSENFIVQEKLKYKENKNNNTETESVNENESDKKFNIAENENEKENKKEKPSELENENQSEKEKENKDVREEYEEESKRNNKNKEEIGENKKDIHESEKEKQTKKIRENDIEKDKNKQKETSIKMKNSQVNLRTNTRSSTRSSVNSDRYKFKQKNKIKETESNKEQKEHHKQETESNHQEHQRKSTFTNTSEKIEEIKDLPSPTSKRTTFVEPLPTKNKRVDDGHPTSENEQQHFQPLPPERRNSFPGFPDFSKLEKEHAIKYEFNPRNGKWKQSDVYVKMAPKPFAKGAMRYAYHLQVLDEKPPISFSNSSRVEQHDNAANTSISSQKFVAKISIRYQNQYEKRNAKRKKNITDQSAESMPSSPRGCFSWFMGSDESESIFDDREDSFQDVQLQMYAKQWAALFNQYDPPKKVDFVPAFCLDLIDRPGIPTVCVEPFIEGTYKKHNNNFGYVSEEARNTPQAFSHFTYHASAHTLLICDIQGVGDIYTDPLMHSTTNENFGRGNLGAEGMEKFLASHSCNAICRYFKLPPVNAKPSDCGTVPAYRISPVPPRPTQILGSEFSPDLTSLSPPPAPLQDQGCPCILL